MSREQMAAHPAGASLHRSLGTEVTLHHAMCTAGMELCTGIANVMGPPRERTSTLLLFLIPAAVGRSLLDLTSGMTHGSWQAVCI